MGAFGVLPSVMQSGTSASTCSSTATQKSCLKMRPRTTQKTLALPTGTPTRELTALVVITGAKVTLLVVTTTGMRLLLRQQVMTTGMMLQPLKPLPLLSLLLLLLVVGMAPLPKLMLLVVVTGPRAVMPHPRLLAIPTDGN